MELLRITADLTSLITLSDIVHTREQKSMGLAWECIEYVKLYTQSMMMQTCQNDLGFNLYAMLSVYYIVTISEN